MGAQNLQKQLNCFGWSRGFRATDAQKHNEDICAILIEGLDVVTAL